MKLQCAEIGAPRASRQRSRFTEGCFFSPEATRAGELRAEEQQLAQEQARWELEDKLEGKARRELQLQVLETHARASPGRREGIAAAQALGGGRGYQKRSPGLAGGVTAGGDNGDAAQFSCGAAAHRGDRRGGVGGRQVAQLVSVRAAQVGRGSEGSRGGAGWPSSRAGPCG